MRPRLSLVPPTDVHLLLLVLSVLQVVVEYHTTAGGGVVVQAFSLREGLPERRYRLLPSSSRCRRPLLAQKQTSHYCENYRDEDDDGGGGAMTRSQWFQQIMKTTTSSVAAVATTISTWPTAPPAATAFEGGIGGLGKTKPELGVAFLSPPEQDVKTGLVTAELLVEQLDKQEIPLIVRFESPDWPLLPTAAGLQVRDVRQPESTFVQIVSDPALRKSKTNGGRLDKATVRDVILTQHVLSSTGKFGAYGSPTDLKVQQVPARDDASSSSSSSSLWQATFTTLTPGLRESDRRVLVQCVPVLPSSSSSADTATDTYLILVAGTTLQRFGKQEPALRRLVESLLVVPAPATRLASLRQQQKESND